MDRKPVSSNNKTATVRQQSLSARNGSSHSRKEDASHSPLPPTSSLVEPPALAPLLGLEVSAIHGTPSHSPAIPIVSPSTRQHRSRSIVVGNGFNGEDMSAVDASTLLTSSEEEDPTEEDEEDYDDSFVSAGTDFELVITEPSARAPEHGEEGSVRSLPSSSVEDGGGGSSTGSLHEMHHDTISTSELYAAYDETTRELEASTAEALHQSGPILSVAPPLAPISTDSPSVGLVRTDSQSVIPIRSSLDRKSSVRSLLSATPVSSNLDLVDSFPTDRFRRWASALAVVTFDLEFGQTIEYLYPAQTILAEGEKNTIRFSSFPDSNSSFTGDTVFTFRTKSNSVQDEALFGYVFFRQKRDPTIRRGYLQKSLVLLSPHCYPGLFLRVISILGPLYFEAMHPTPENSPLASPVLSLANLLQSDRKPGHVPPGTPLRSPSTRLLHGVNVLDAFAREIANWPARKEGVLLEIRLVNAILLAEIPRHDDPHARLIETSTFFRRRGKIPGLASTLLSSPASPSASPFSPSSQSVLGKEPLLASVPCSVISPYGFLYPLPYMTVPYQPTDLPGTSMGFFLRFLPLLEHLWTLWELVLTGKPIVVIGRHPAVVSECVLWLRELIRPIPSQSKWWPYLTVQDTNFRQLQHLFPPGAPSGTRSPLFTSHPSSSSSYNNKNRTISNGTYYTSKTAAHVRIRECLLGADHSAPSPSSRPATPTKPPPTIKDETSIIVGVTNPFFLKAFESWPNILRVGGGELPNSESVKRIRKRKPRANQDVAGKGALEHQTLAAPQDSASPSSFKQFAEMLTLRFSKKPDRASSNSTIQATASAPALGRPRSKSGTISSSLDFSPGLVTRNKPILARDKKLISYLRNLPIPQILENGSFLASPSTGSFPGLSRPTTDASSSKSSAPPKGYAVNELLRRNFVDLTEQFLVPLNRYFSTLIPTIPAVDICSDPSLYKLAPPMSKVKPFDVPAFLRHLSAYGPPNLPYRSSSAKSEWLDLYVRFLDGPNFLGWLKERKCLAEYEVRRAYVEVLSHVDIAPALQNPSYCFFVFARIRAELDLAQQNPYPSTVHPKGWSHLHALPPRYYVASGEQVTLLLVLAEKLWQALPPKSRVQVSSGKIDFPLEKSLAAEDDYILVC